MVGRISGLVTKHEQQQGQPPVERHFWCEDHPIGVVPWTKPTAWWGAPAKATVRRHSTQACSSGTVGLWEVITLRPASFTKSLVFTKFTCT